MNNYLFFTNFSLNLVGISTTILSHSKKIFWYKHSIIDFKNSKFFTRIKSIFIDSYNILWNLYTKNRRINDNNIFSEREMVISYIQQRYNDNNIATTHSVEHYIYDEFNKVIKSDWHTKLLDRLNVAKSLLAKPIESTRAEVPIDDIKEYYSKLYAFFNYDNLYIQLWKKTCICRSPVLNEFILTLPVSGIQIFTFIIISNNAKRHYAKVEFALISKNLII